MTEPIGYNDNHFDDLPNEDRSWEKMNRMLDEDDRRRRAVPFWFRFSALGVLLLGLGFAGWMMFSGDGSSKPEQISKEINKGNQSNITTEELTNNSDDPASRSKENGISDQETNNEDGPADPVDGNEQRNNRVIPSKEISSARITADKNNSDLTPGNDKLSKDPNTLITKGKPDRSGKQAGKRPVSVAVVTRQFNRNISTAKKSTTALKDNRKKSDIDIPADSKIKGNDPVNKTSDANDTGQPTNTQSKIPAIKSDPTKLQSPSPVIPDPPAKKADVLPQVDTAKQKEAVAAIKEKAKNKKPLQWSVGISFQQPLALGSQGMSEYNYKGNKSFIADHLPGMYVTAGKDKWNVGAEFNYGVPQPVKQIFFSQTSKYDPSNVTLNVERFSVEKMYYHQFSISGNYFLLPRLSAGVGGTYNLLTGAVTERELTSSNVITGNTQTQTSLAPVKGYKDSFLFKSTAAAFLQSEYHWNRIKLGVRYTYALQPYMRYTKPDGTIEDVTNNTLQLLLRFQLWKK